MFYFGFSEKEDWFYTSTFGVYQKVNKDVYCYVSRYIGFYTVQLYKRGTAYLCTLEARSKDDVEGLFELGEKWLNEHEKWDDKILVQSQYHITQPNWKENCWI